VVKVSVILINWNGLALTTRALESLQAEARGVSHEVIVVDNASSDGSQKQLPRLFPELCLIENQENVGFGRACNQAVGRASGEVLLFLNNDTLQLEDTVEKGCRVLEQNPAIGALGIKHLDGSASRAWQPSAFRFPSPWLSVLACLGLGWPWAPPPGYGEGEGGPVDWVTGSFLMVRRDVWERVGGFDERFFVYDEDLDWCRRARRLGFSVWYWPELSMIHLGAASAPSLRDKTFMHLRSRLTYFRKHGPLLGAAAFYAALSARLAGSAGLQLVKLGLGRSDPVALGERLSRLFNFVCLHPTQAGLGTR
jgi:GT2 family glycosyltransferase